MIKRLIAAAAVVCASLLLAVPAVASPQRLTGGPMTTYAAAGSGVHPRSIVYAYYELISNNSQKCLDDFAYGNDNGASIVQWHCISGAYNQQWRTEPTDSGYFRLISGNNQKCLDVLAYNQADGASVVLWDCVPGATNQQWRLVPTGVGGGYYQLRARHSDKCLDVLAYSRADGASVVQWTCLNGPNQQWRFF